LTNVNTELNIKVIEKKVKGFGRFQKEIY
jgi:hypothetical protein